MTKHFYFDESSQCGWQYLGVSGIGINKDDISSFCRKVKEIKSQNQRKENKIHWKDIRKNCSPHKLKFYNEIIDFFFQKIRDKDIYFFCVISEKKYTRSNIFGLIQSMLIWRCCFNFNNENIYAFGDRSRHQYNHLTHKINKKANEEEDIDDPGILKRIANPSPKGNKYSESAGEIQEINDLILGAIMYFKNKRHVDNPDHLKTLISNYLLYKSRRKGYDFDTGRKNRFNIWNFKTKKENI